MSVSALSHSRQDGSGYEIIRNNLSKPGNWTYLIPTIGAIALGILYAPHFALGIGAGTVSFVVMSFALIAVSVLGLTTPDEDSEYAKSIHDNPLQATLGAPILEEGFFRGGIQPLLIRGVLWLAPAATAAFMGTGVSIAAIVSVVATAAIFGATHGANEHKNAHIQAIFATVGGIAYGLLSLHFGLGCSIAAHIANNTLATTLDRLFYEEKPPQSTSAASSNGMMRV